MPDSTFVYDQGNLIHVGNPVKNDFVYADGQLVSDSDVSQFAFIEGRGLGGTVDCGTKTSVSVDWKTNIHNDSVNGVDFNSNGVFSGGNDANVRRLDDADGSGVWKHDHHSPYPVEDAIADSSQVFSVDQSNPLLVAADQSDGSQNWSVGLSGDPQNLATDGTNIFVPTDKVEVYDKSGNSQYTISLSFTPLTIAVDDTTIYVGENSVGGDTLAAYDKSTKNQIWSITLTDFSRGTIAGDGDVFVTIDTEGTGRYDGSDGSEKWLKTSNLFPVGGGAYRSGLVVTDGQSDTVGFEASSGNIQWRDTAGISNTDTIDAAITGTCRVYTARGDYVVAYDLS